MKGWSGEGGRGKEEESGVIYHDDSSKFTYYTVSLSVP